MKRRIGIFGGTFDPVHFGHLSLAINLMEAYPLDEVLFVPTFLSPFKENTPPITSVEHRKKMLTLAIEPVKKFRLLDWEMRAKGPVFTIDTVRKLSEDPSLQLFLIIGEDHVASFHRWKEAEVLMRLAPPLIGTADILNSQLQFPVEFEEKLRAGLVKIPLLDIRSTEVRHRLNQKKYCGHLVPATVLDYIGNHHLY